MAQQQTIIIKKIKKGGGGHHGGAWKIAYADFVTAMMAFFLLLWLLNSVTQEQLEGISNYFAPVSVSASTSGSGGMLGGQTISEGAMVSTMAPPTVTDELPEPKASKDSSESVDEETGGPPGDADAEQQVRQKEDQQFKEAEKTLHQAIKNVPALQKLSESLLIDNTPEGLRIQLVDQEGLPMFPSGSSELYPYAVKLLRLVAEAIKELPQKITISGYTDAVKYVTDNGYSNWELSADRANASRRALIHMGVDAGRIARVVGKADTEPLLPDDPTNARNRRLSIVLLRLSSHNKGKEPKNKAAEPQASENGRETSPTPAADTSAEPAPEPAPEPAQIPEQTNQPATVEEPAAPPATTPETAPPVQEPPQEPVQGTNQEAPVEKSAEDSVAPAPPPPPPVSARRPKLTVIGQ